MQELLDYYNDDNLYCNDISGDDSDYDDILQGIGSRTAGFLTRKSRILGANVDHDDDEAMMIQR